MRGRQLIGGAVVAVGLAGFAAMVRQFVLISCDYWPYCWPF